MIFGKKLRDGFGGRLPDPVNADKVRPNIRFTVKRGIGGIGKGLKRAEMARQQLGRALADMTNTQTVDKPVEGDCPPFLDGREKVGDAGRAPALTVLQFRLGSLVACCQREDVGGMGDQPLAVEGLDLFGAQTVDIEGIAGDEVF